MEKFRKYFTIKKSVGIWVWLGRVAPLTALLMLGIVLIFDFTSWLHYLIMSIGITFAITAFTWWWWVIYAVKDIFRLLNDANVRFGEVLQELKAIRKEYIKKDDVKRR
jgi:hypothetical protein